MPTTCNIKREGRLGHGILEVGELWEDVAQRFQKVRTLDLALSRWTQRESQ
jgi:hypothetical protein